jgi:hypothetical protein
VERTVITQHQYNGQYWYVCELKEAISREQLAEIVENLTDVAGHFVQYTFEQTNPHYYGPIYDVLFADNDDAMLFKLLYSDL